MFNEGSKLVYRIHVFFEIGGWLDSKIFTFAPCNWELLPFPDFQQQCSREIFPPPPFSMLLLRLLQFRTVILLSINFDWQDPTCCQDPNCPKRCFLPSLLQSSCHSSAYTYLRSTVNALHIQTRSLFQQYALDP